MSFYDGKDRYFYPVVVTQENNTVVFTEGGSSDLNFSISPGVYWAHLDLDLTLRAEYPSLLLEIRNGLENKSPNDDDYSIDEKDLSAGDLRYSSLTWTNDAGRTFKFRFTDSEFTLSPGYFGYPKDENSDPSGTSIDGTVSVLGQWISPAPAAFKDRDVSKNVFRSDKGPNAVVNSWTPAKDTRNIKYWKVPGSFVYDSRAKTNTDGTADGLPDNDTNNAFEDVIRAMGDSRILAKYNVSDESDAMEFNTESPSVSESWQSQAGDVKLSEARGDREKWEGEHYDLAWPAVIYENEPVLDGYGH